MSTPPDAKLTLSIDWPELTLDKLSRLTNIWSDVVSEVGAGVLGRRGAFRLVLTDISLSSPLQVHTEPALTKKPSATRHVDPALLTSIGQVVVSGVRHLSEHEERPHHFSARALELTRKLALFSDSKRRIIVSNGVGDPAILSLRVASAVDGILGPALSSYGSVEGRLEGIITHGQRRFYVYDSLSGCQVRCFFGSSTSLDDLFHYFERRVIVSGLVRSKAFTGQPTSIHVSDICDLKPDTELLPTDEILRKWEQTR